MTLDFFAKTSGTWINVLAVALGTSLGLLLKHRLPVRMQRNITQGVALITLFIGFSMAGSLTQVKAGRVDSVVLGLITMVLGGLLGEWWQIEAKLESLGDWLKARFKGSGSLTQGFVVASLLFCVGPMTVLGSLSNGLTGDDTLLTLKSVMDGISSVALSSSFGIGVGFSIVIILLYQGGISLVAGVLAQALPNPATDPQILLITGVGGLMILGTGINLLELTQVRVASFLPALGLAPVLYQIAKFIG
ncbi:DUF554 domain-containing protein [Microcoleus sp. FACHB-SPT15]|uniref:DUF554 domain-containing protein n=1 Tax=Microcoleus sp. FACHB-SPT15 TaxID=2692830 RepID=UPI0017852A57|nr:DUF554 domain-containing protein [Microcoleus sp. FACHB-SPT15]MBD1805896.1 DUF554 domain-containing protein [Microcoleus sp. FACHB-SPT15]